MTGRCPRCRRALVRVAEPPFVVWRCDDCGGASATIAVLRKGIRHEALKRAWAHTIGHARRSQLKCPDCVQTMWCVPTEGPEIDLCRNCQLIWFDANELDELPHRSAEELERERAEGRWQQELRDMQRRRERDEEFLAFVRRR